MPGLRPETADAPESRAGAQRIVLKAQGHALDAHDGRHERDDDGEAERGHSAGDR